MQPAPPPPPITLPTPPANRRALPFQMTWVQLVGLLVAVALVAVVATAGTGLGLLYYLAQRPAPTVAPVYRVPVYQPPAQPPARTNPLQPSTEQRLQEAERQACDARKRAYAAEVQAYQTQKQAQAQGAPRAPFLIEPSPPFC